MKSLASFFLSTALVFLSLNAIRAQPQNIILMSDSLKLDLSTNPPSVSHFPIGLDLSNPFLCHGTSTAAYTDSNGKLLLGYSNAGYYQEGYFFDSIGGKIQGCKPRGSCILPHSLILHHPNSEYYHILALGEDTAYTSFCAMNPEPCVQIYHHLLRYDKPSRTFTILKCNELLLEGPNSLALHPIKHANGKDWWILTHTKIGNTFTKFLLTNESFIAPITQQIGPLIPVKVRRGNIDFNYRTNNLLYSVDGDRIDLFSFSRCTGELTFLSSPRNNYVEEFDLDNVYSTMSYFSPNGENIISLSVNFISATKINRQEHRLILPIDTIINISRFLVPTRFSWVTFFDKDRFIFAYFCKNRSGSIYNGCDTNLQRSIGQISNLDSSLSSITVNPNYLTLNRRVWGTMPVAINYDAPAVNPLPSNCVTYAENEKIRKLTLYPNPATTTITLKANAGSLNGQLSFYNLSGQVVYQTNISNESTHEWSVSGLPSGIYNLRLADGTNEPFVQKVVVSQ